MLDGYGHGRAAEEAAMDVLGIQCVIEVLRRQETRAGWLESLLV